MLHENRSLYDEHYVALKSYFRCSECRPVENSHIAQIEHKESPQTVRDERRQVDDRHTRQCLQLIPPTTLFALGNISHI